MFWLVVIVLIMLVSNRWQHGWNGQRRHEVQITGRPDQSVARTPGDQRVSFFFDSSMDCDSGAASGACDHIGVTRV